MSGRDAESGSISKPELPLLELPADGIPPVVDTAQALADAVARLKAGHGPVALDAERAQGYRYGAEAYLIQLRRDGSGTHLIDPRAFVVDGQVRLPDLAEVLEPIPWILHAASQDLDCLLDAGLRPSRLFDTELAARLLHRERVGLGPLLEDELGIRLRKEHSAADWSRRPLPADWLAYAALDVELLIPLAARLRDALAAAGKLDWAEEEFAALVAGVGAPREARVDPWRRLHGLSTVKSPAGLALARELWRTRDELAQRLDKGPSKVVTDHAITALAALVDPRQKRWPGRADVRSIGDFHRRTAQRFEANWIDAIERAAALPRSQWPPRHAQHEGPSRQPRNWERRHPEAYARWLALRPAVNAVAEAEDLPPENLLSPAALRAVAWAPAGMDALAVAQQLRDEGARAWQVRLTTDAIVAALAQAGGEAPEAE